MEVSATSKVKTMSAPPLAPLVERRHYCDSSSLPSHILRRTVPSSPECQQSKQQDLSVFLWRMVLTPLLSWGKG